MLTTISMVKDITGFRVGDTLYPCLREVLLAMDPGFAFCTSHTTDSDRTSSSVPDKKVKR